MVRGTGVVRRQRPVMRAVGLAGVALLLACCGSAPGATEQGRQIHALYNVLLAVLLAIAAVIAVLVEGLILWSVLRYRRRDDQLPPQIHGHSLLEATWTVIPLVIVLVLFALSWQVLNRVDAKAANPSVRVVVQAFQWSGTSPGAATPARR